MSRDDGATVSPAGEAEREPCAQNSGVLCSSGVIDSRVRAPYVDSMRMFASRRKRKGITLFEAVAAVAMVGATAAAALSAVASQYRTTARAQRALVVEALATSRLDFLDLLDQDRDLASLPDSVAQGEFPAPLDEYSWKTEVAPVSDEAGLYTVRILVLWKDGQYELKSRAFRRPPITSANR